MCIKSQIEAVLIGKSTSEKTKFLGWSCDGCDAKRRSRVELLLLLHVFHVHFSLEKVLYFLIIERLIDVKNNDECDGMHINQFRGRFVPEISSCKLIENKLVP